MNDTSEHNGGEVVLYESPDGDVRLDVRLEHESIWLTQRQMAELFGRERSVITLHMQRASADDELSLESNVQKVHIASSDKPVSLYSLDAVISVRYRVNSVRGKEAISLESVISSSSHRRALDSYACTYWEVW